MTRTKWQDVLELAKYFAENDYLGGIKLGSWEKKNAMRDLEDSLRMNTIWDKYKGTDEEDDIMDFFIEEYNKELERFWNVTDHCPDCNVYCEKRFIDGGCE